MKMMSDMKERKIISKRDCELHTFTQEWKNETTAYITVFHKDLHKNLSIVAFASVTESKGNFNYRQINDLCVREEYRGNRLATGILDFIDELLPTERKYTAVAVEADAPDWLVDMYNKRGYLIWQV